MTRRSEWIYRFFFVENGIFMYERVYMNLIVGLEWNWSVSSCKSIEHDGRKSLDVEICEMVLKQMCILIVFGLMQGYLPVSSHR